MEVLTCQAIIDREDLKHSDTDKTEYTFTKGDQELPEDFFMPLIELLLEV